MCNNEVEGRAARESRERWREPDGFAKAAEPATHRTDRSWEDRLRDSILITNTGKDPIKLVGLDGVGRQVEPGDSVEYVRQEVPPPDPKVVKEILDEEEPTGQLTGGSSEVSLGNSLSIMHRSPLFVTMTLAIYTGGQRELDDMVRQFGHREDSNPQKEVIQALINAEILERSGTRVLIASHMALELYARSVGAVRLPVRRWVSP